MQFEVAPQRIYQPDLMSTDPTIPTAHHERYINRELSWLAFNARVLEEAENNANPLVERMNFLAISASNLDEFYMVRVAGLKDYASSDIEEVSIDGLTPVQELDLVHSRIFSLMKAQETCWEHLQQQLADQSIIEVADCASLRNKERHQLREYFARNLFPVLTPIAIDPAHPFPFLPNLGLAMAFSLKLEKQQEPRIAIVSLPTSLPRFIPIEGDECRVILLEDIIYHFVDMLFPGLTVKESVLFRVVRDSEIEMEDEGEDFVRIFERALKERRRGRVINVQFALRTSDTNRTAHLRQFVAEHLDVMPDEIWCTESLLNMRDLKSLYSKCDNTHKYPVYHERYPERLGEFNGDCFAAIAAKDIVIHHPYESFDVVVQFLKQAASDPSVVSIKQTLYRTSKDSPIVKALIQAAEAGKSVTALVELKARFDEEANIQFAKVLERAGVQVNFGFVDLKTHAKVSLITRWEDEQLASYVHFGTGNYHPATAKLYTDLSFFTRDPDLCRDAAYFFNFVTGYAPPKTFHKLVVAPRDMRHFLEERIAQEISHAKEGKPAAIWAKMNALVDKKLIDALYEASQAGVAIDLVVRGICCLKPGVAGFSDNIRVKSIIGRFLEHSRIYCFANGHALPSAKALVLMGSADWMTRNLDFRVETLVPIENPTVHAQILDQIMVANLKDEKQSWLMQSDGSYKRVKPGKNQLSAHQYFMLNPSLSGRGSALKNFKPSENVQLHT